MKTSHQFVQVDPFDGNIDNERPIEGSVIDFDGKSCIIDRVDWVLCKTWVTNPAKPPLNGSDEILYIDHTTRPILWRCWVTYLKDSNNDTC